MDIAKRISSSNRPHQGIKRATTPVPDDRQPPLKRAKCGKKDEISDFPSAQSTRLPGAENADQRCLLMTVKSEKSRVGAVGQFEPLPSPVKPRKPRSVPEKPRTPSPRRDGQLRRWKSRYGDPQWALISGFGSGFGSDSREDQSLWWPALPVCDTTLKNRITGAQGYIKSEAESKIIVRVFPSTRGGLRPVYAFADRLAPFNPTWIPPVPVSRELAARLLRGLHELVDIYWQEKEHFSQSAPEESDQTAAEAGWRKIHQEILANDSTNNSTFGRNNTEKKIRIVNEGSLSGVDRRLADAKEVLAGVMGKMLINYSYTEADFGRPIPSAVRERRALPEAPPLMCSFDETSSEAPSFVHTWESPAVPIPFSVPSFSGGPTEAPAASSYFASQEFEAPSFTQMSMTQDSHVPVIPCPPPASFGDLSFGSLAAVSWPLASLNALEHGLSYPGADPLKLSGAADLMRLSGGKDPMKFSIDPMRLSVPDYFDQMRFSTASDA